MKKNILNYLGTTYFKEGESHLMNLSGLVMIFLMLVGFLLILTLSLMVVGVIIYCRKKGYKMPATKMTLTLLISFSLLYATGITKIVHELFFTILWLVITGS